MAYSSSNIALRGKSQRRCHPRTGCQWAIKRTFLPGLTSRYPCITDALKYPKRNFPDPLLTFSSYLTHTRAHLPAALGAIPNQQQRVIPLLSRGRNQGATAEKALLQCSLLRIKHELEIRSEARSRPGESLCLHDVWHLICSVQSGVYWHNETGSALSLPATGGSPASTRHTHVQQDVATLWAAPFPPATFNRWQRSERQYLQR